MSRVVVLGAGGHAREIADVVEACREDGEDLELVGYLDRDASRHGEDVLGVPVLGATDWLEGQRARDLVVVAGVGSPRGRRSAVQEAERFGVAFGTFVHPRATVTRHVELGEGVVITAGCVLTNNIEIGRHTHINRMATVGHDCRVGEFVHLAPGVVLSGNVHVEDDCDIGTNACVIQNLRIGRGTVVGAGAAVVRDLPAGVTAVGVPARPRS